MFDQVDPVELGDCRLIRLAVPKRAGVAEGLFGGQDRPLRREFAGEDRHDRVHDQVRGRGAAGEVVIDVDRLVEREDGIEEFGEGKLAFLDLGLGLGVDPLGVYGGGGGD